MEPLILKAEMYEQPEHSGSADAAGGSREWQPSDGLERNGYTASPLSLVDPEVYAELVRSPDEGVAEFLDLARVKPNTLGNTRMLKILA